MKEQIIEMLHFPRQMVRGGMELFDCPHSGNYDNNDHVCKQCLDGLECQWLYATDSVAALETRPISDLSEALKFAVLSVAAEVANQNHDQQSCSCPACNWLRSAESMLQQVY